MTHTLSSWFTLPLYKLLALYDSLFLSLWLTLHLSDLLSLSMTYSPPLWLHHSLYDLLFPSMTYSPSICPITPFMTYFTALIFSLWLTLFHYIWLFLPNLFSLSMTYTPLHDLLYLSMTYLPFVFTTYFFYFFDLLSISLTFSDLLSLSFSLWLSHPLILYDLRFLYFWFIISLSYPPSLWLSLCVSYPFSLHKFSLWLTLPLHVLPSLSMNYFPFLWFTLPFYDLLPSL